MAGSASAPSYEIRLSERIQYASDLADACHILLEQVFRTTDFDRALVVVRHEDGLHAVGYGIEDEHIGLLTAPTTPSGRRLRDLIDSGELIRVDGDELPETLFAAITVVPFPGPRGIPSGAVLFNDPEGKGPGALAGSIRSVGPTLARLMEIDVLQRRLERKEQHSSLLDAVVDSLADPVILTDSQNNFLFANRRAEHLFSARPHESDGRRRAVRVNDLLFSSFLTQAVISGGEPASRELNLVDPTDGSDLLFEVFTVPLPSGAGQEGAIISVLRDISDLRRALNELEVQFNRSRVAEHQARRESDRLNAILTNASDPILVTNDDSKIILMNAAAERLFEFQPTRDTEERPETAPQRAVRTNDTKFTTLISDFLLQPDPKRVETLVLSDPRSGMELPIEVASSKILNPRGEPTAIVSVLHDLTQVVENERLARELQILNEGLEERIRLATEELEERNRRLEWQSRELQKASRLKSEFLASMSHELRTPINAMLGYTALMREKIYGELNDKQDNALRKIYGASQHLLALINDILDLSKIEAGKMPVRVEQVRIEAIVSELSQTIEPMVREKRLAYHAELSEHLPVLRTDRTKVKQILLNLLSNALKFTHEGTVTLRASPAGDDSRVQIMVEDTGIGIRDEDLEAIFDDFRQADQSSTRKYGGTGLGLSITRKLVTLLRGSIRVESAYGSGSRFTVELPMELQVDEDDDARPHGSEADTGGEEKWSLQESPAASEGDVPGPSRTGRAGEASGTAAS